MIETLCYIISGYAIVSLALLLFPLRRKGKILTHPLFQKALQRKGTLHISHRGGSRERLENTMEAFQHAVSSGTNMLEMDVVYTKDKKVIVSHDSLMIRMCGVNAHTHEYNYDELPKILDQVTLDFAHKGTIDSTNCKTRYFPLLDDVFKAFPTTLINVEIKTPNPEINRDVNDLIKKYHREDLTVWGARLSSWSDELYRLNPRIRRFFSAQRVLSLYGLYLTGLLPFFDIPEDSLQIPLCTAELTQWKLSGVSSIKERVGTHFFYAIIRFLNFVSPPLFYHLRKRGILIVYWVLNEREDMETALKAGVHGIMTDNPNILKDLLKLRGQYID